MGTKILKIGLLITATQFLFANSCKKEGNTKPCQYSNYSFDVTSVFSPQEEVYNVGDTIYLTSTFPKNLLNATSNQLVDYSNSVGIGGTVSFIQMDTITHNSLDAYNRFELFLLKGTYTQIQNVPNNGINSNYLETSIYEFKVGITLKQKGLYFFNSANLGSQGLKNQNCTNAGFNMTVTNSNKHFNLFQYALNYYPDALLEKSIYCFRVH